MLVGALFGAGCGSAQKCMPGATQACLGPGACNGGQACAATGNAWEACACSTDPTGGTGGGDGGGDDAGGGDANDGGHSSGGGTASGDGGHSSDGGHASGGGGQSSGDGGTHAGGGAGGGTTNPCLTNNGGCAADATCTPGGGGATCACNPRFTGDGLTCLWNDPTLSGLTIEPGTLAFKASTTLYAVDVPAATYSVLVTPTVAMPSRTTITVNQQPLDPDGTATVVLGGTAKLTMPVLVTTDSGAQKTYTVVLIRGFGQQAYAKAFNTDTNDNFGNAVALSGDGNTLVVGACNESSAATGFGGDGADNSALRSGAVYVFARSGAQWAQETYVKASHTDPNDLFGYSVALSTDGNTLAVGAKGEASKATSINGDETDDSAPSSGAVYVFGRSGTDWVQRAYVKASNSGSYDAFGTCVALNADGTTLAVGARGESSSATGVGGNESDNDAGRSGAAYVFAFNGATWSQQAYIKASNTDGGDEFGSSIALNSDGNTLAVGAPGEASKAKGVGGSQTDNSATLSGAVYVFLRSGVDWAQQAYLKASNTEMEDQFGFSLALSGDGDTLAVGALGESSAGTGVGGSQSNNDAGSSGAVYVFTRSGDTWAQQAYVKASNTGAQDAFGHSVALSSDGETLAVGAQGEAGNTTGAWGNQTDGGVGVQANDSAPSAGAVYVFGLGAAGWGQQSYVKASNTGAYDFFGASVALSSNGATLAVAAPYEDSSAQGVGGDQADNDAGSSGAVYVFTR